MFDAIQSGVRGAKPSGKAEGFVGRDPSPNQGDGQGRGYSQWFWGMVPSRGMVKVGLMYKRGEPLHPFNTILFVNS